MLVFGDGFKLSKLVMCVVQHEWRALGVQQSGGWVHYAIHPPEPHVLLFRRPLGYQQQQPAQQPPAQADALHGKYLYIIERPFQLIFLRLFNTNENSANIVFPPYSNSD